QICWELHDINIFTPSKGIRGKLQTLFLKTVSQPTLVGKYADIIIVHAYSLKKKLEERGVKGNKIHVILHFDYMYLLDSNNNKPTALDFALPKDYALFFGKIAPWKGISVLVNAARILSKQVYKFTIVIAGGSFYEDENETSPIEDLLTKEDHDHIQILNKYIINSEIPELFKKSAFLILPYTNAFQYSTSGVIPLAYTFSKPVIVSDVPSLVEYVDHGKTGFVFEAGNSSQLANYIIELLEDNRKCIEMGNNAYQKMLQEMSLERFCQLLNDLYVDTERR
nr:glycosyltransferase family 4 protein [Thermoproteota archaeon]